MLGLSFIEGLFSIQVIAFFLALYGTDVIALFVSGCFVFGADQFLSEGVGGFELP